MKAYWWTLPVAGTVFAVGLIITTFLFGAHQYGGVYQDPPKPAGDVRMTDESGKPAALSELRGQWVLLAFGYTTCPDVCPTTLARLAEVRRQLGAEAADVRVAFVTVDPARDNVARIAAYVHRFDETFKGFTGTDQELTAAAQAYGVSYSRVESDSAAGYLMSHTAFVYLIDPQFRIRVVYPFGVESDEITHDLRYLFHKES
ncbi:MAG: SCO family protein [Chloroflexi bacterium]|nr:SCO family protein [Chloroflexota bacterium]